MLLTLINLIIIILLLILFLIMVTSIKKVEKKGYELSMVCDDHIKALEIRDYPTNKLKKTISLPNNKNSYILNITEIPGSRVILYCYNSQGTAGGGGCIKDDYGIHCFIWKSWENIELNFCNYEYRTIYGTWYFLYKLKQYSCCNTYGFFTTLPNKYFCHDSEINTVTTCDDHSFSLYKYIEYEGENSWGLYTVFLNDVDYVTYDEGEQYYGTKVATYYAHELDQYFEFYSNIPGLYSIAWAGYGDWEYYHAPYDNCYYNIRVCYHSCGGCDSSIQGYILDDNKKEWIKCYKTCKTCTKIGNETYPYCLSCNNQFPFLIIGGKCVNNSDGYYKDKITNKYLKCNKRCQKCSMAGTDEKSNCIVCAFGYHFVYTIKNHCIKKYEKPNDSYYEIKTNTFEKCRVNNCAKCLNKYFCEECQPGFHRINEKPNVCFHDKDIPNSYYYDPYDDYYKPCYKKCVSCKFKGDNTNLKFKIIEK